MAEVDWVRWRSNFVNNITYSRSTTVPPGSGVDDYSIHLNHNTTSHPRLYHFLYDGLTSAPMPASELIPRLPESSTGFPSIMMSISACVNMRGSRRFCGHVGNAGLFFMCRGANEMVDGTPSNQTTHQIYGLGIDRRTDGGDIADGGLEFLSSSSFESNTTTRSYAFSSRPTIGGFPPHLINGSEWIQYELAIVQDFKFLENRFYPWISLVARQNLGNSVSVPGSVGWSNWTRFRGISFTTTNHRALYIQSTLYPYDGISPHPLGAQQGQATPRLFFPAIGSLNNGTFTGAGQAHLHFSHVRIRYNGNAYNIFY